MKIGIASGVTTSGEEQ
jgi:hypothetical protein